jgi:hypothetical protein
MLSREMYRMTCKLLSLGDASKTLLYYRASPRDITYLERGISKPQRIPLRQMNRIRNLGMQRQRIRQKVDILANADICRAGIRGRLRHRAKAGSEHRCGTTFAAGRSHTVGRRVDTLVVAGTVCCGGVCLHCVLLPEMGRHRKEPRKRRPEQSNE